MMTLSSVAAAARALDWVAAADGLEPPCCAATTETDRMRSVSPCRDHSDAGRHGALVLLVSGAPAEHRCYLWHIDKEKGWDPFVQGSTEMTAAVAVSAAAEAVAAGCNVDDEVADAGAHCRRG